MVFRVRTATLRHENPARRRDSKSRDATRATCGHRRASVHRGECAGDARCSGQATRAGCPPRVKFRKAEARRATGNKIEDGVSNDEFQMTNDEEISKFQSQSASFRFLEFGILSSFDIRHLEFRFIAASISPASIGTSAIKSVLPFSPMTIVFSNRTPNPSFGI